MRVRRMQAGEGERLRELRREALTLAPEAFGASHADERPLAWYQDLARGPGAVLVLGEWNGMIGVRIAEDERPWLWGTWVSPAHRRAGSGRRLLGAAIEWARVRGFESLHLEVVTEPARKLYEAGGFTGGRFMSLPLHRPPRRIKTERLVIREYTPADFEALHAIYTHPPTMVWLYDEVSTEEESRATLRRRIGRTRFALTGDGLGLAAERDGELVADLSLNLRSAEHLQGELGFVVHHAHEGRGYATEAAAALRDLLFGTFGLHRVVGRTEARNAGSARVLEKIGMTREALLVENEIVKGEWQSELVYAIRATASRGA